MRYCYNLKKISLIAAAAILLPALIAGCKNNLDSSVTISGISYPSDTKVVTLTDYPSDDYTAFAKLESLKTLDVTALNISAENVESIRSQVGDNVDVIWSVPFNGSKIPSNAPELTLSGDISKEDASAVKYFNSLKSLQITTSEVNDNLCSLIDAATENNSELNVNCSAKIYGADVDSSMELLDLNNIPIESPDLLCLAIEIFPNIKTIEMCDCGLSNEVMQGLREEYPEIKFVWTISFLNFKIRTDVQVFSTLAKKLDKPGNTKTFEPIFKYCTELRALDLGHMAITDISEIRNLKKLHTLILADNYISDISPIAELKDLVYVELFQNKISDISPLLDLPNLEDLNMCYNAKVKDPVALTSKTKLKRLYMSFCGLERSDILQLKEGLPADCEFNYTARNCVYDGWRSPDNVRNAKIREAFKNWKKIKEYPTWDNIVYK